VFGKKDNTHAVELSDIAAGTGGFVINGESAGDFSGHSLHWRLTNHYNRALTRH
jgi:hypothetical protein